MTLPLQSDQILSEIDRIVKRHAEKDIPVVSVYPAPGWYLEWNWSKNRVVRGFLPGCSAERKTLIDACRTIDRLRADEHLPDSVADLLRSARERAGEALALLDEAIATSQKVKP